MENRPHPLEFPKGFNPHAVDIWFAACADLPVDERLAWSSALHKYMVGCERAGLLPYLDDIDVDAAIRNYLWSRRQDVVRFLNTTKLMAGMKVIRRITKDVQITAAGFEIRIEAPIRQEDPTWVRRLWHLPLGYRFNMVKEQGRTVLHLNPGLEIYVRNPMISVPSRWIIGYVVKCPLVPSYSGPDSEQDFILNQLWNPLMAVYRPRRINPMRSL